MRSSSYTTEQLREASKLCGAFIFGECSVFVGLEDGWHLSIAHPLHHPSYDEIKEARYQFLPDDIHEVGYIDNFWCIHNYILRLGDIIFRMKKLGWEFESHYGTGPNRKNFIYTPTNWFFDLRSASNSNGQYKKEIKS